MTGAVGCNIELKEKFALLKAKIRSKVDSAGGSMDALQTVRLTSDEIEVSRHAVPLIYVHDI